MKLNMNWPLFYTIGFFVALINLIIERAWLGVLSVGMYVIIVISLEYIRLIKTKRTGGKK